MQRIDHMLHWVSASLRTWLPPAGGAVFLLLWIVAEAGRYAIAEKAAVFALLALAIAFSGWKPLISYAFLLMTPVLQLVGVLYPPMSNSWPMYEAAAFVAFVVGFRATGIARLLVLPVGAVTSVLFAVLMVTPMVPGESHWASWIGRGESLDTYWSDLAALSIGWFVFFTLLWAAGIAGRSILSESHTEIVLREAEARLQETSFELRLSDDRARISRDVHDALAHSLAVIVSQAEGALALKAKRPRAAGEALAAIATVGRTALTDVRALVERITDDDLTAATPGLDDLPEVIARMRSVGMDATLQVSGEVRELHPSRSLAVFRIVQESLTNALKHAGSESTARVTLDWRGPGLAVLVVSSSGKSIVTESAGVGIEGMKDRARLAGGWLRAEPDGDAFLVTAFIPVLTLTREAVDA
ncbi:MAG: sensor histidine kinase [Rhodoglobus sp.]